MKQTARRADAPDGRIAGVTEAPERYWLSRTTRPVFGSTCACAGFDDTSTVTDPAGARLPASVALALPLSPAATCHLTVCVPARQTRSAWNAAAS